MTAEQQAPPVQTHGAKKPGPNGSGMLTVEQILERAPKDLVTKVIEVPEWDGKVTIRTLTAAERSRIRQLGIQAGRSEVEWGEMEVQQFLAGVVDPKMTEAQVRQIHEGSGPGFVHIIAQHDELSDMSKEEIRNARAEFPQDGE